MARSARRYFLIIKAPNGDVREVPLTDSPVVLGRDESADIRVDDKKISRRHASFRLADGRPMVEDLGSSNGVRINDEKIDRKQVFDANDEVSVGSFVVTLKDGEDTGASSVESERRPQLRSRPVVEVVTGTDSPKYGTPSRKPPVKDGPVLRGLDHPVVGQRFVIRRGENVIGRLEECDVPILDGSVSRQHARVIFAKNRVTVTDLGSSNGVFVNEIRVEMAELADGDTLRIGSIKFNVKLPANVVSRVAAPVGTRARKAKTAQRSTVRTLVLVGVASFVLAGGAAAFLKYRARLGIGGPSAVDAGQMAATSDASTGPVAVASIDAGSAAPPPPAVAPPPVKPPPVKPPPVKPPPVKPPPKGPPPAKAAPPVQPPPPPVIAATETATSPFSPRGEDGLPLNLPTVDTTFDFDAFVTAQLAKATDCVGAGDYGCATQAVDVLLVRDPVNKGAKDIRDKAERFSQGKKALAEADRLLARGDYARALRLYESIKDDVPQHAEAKKQAEEIREDAVDQELARGKADLRRASTVRRAHRRFTYVLSIVPDSVEALKGLRAAEKAMRKRKMTFDPYEPGRKPTTERKPSAGKKARIREYYGGDKALAEAARLYSVGSVDKALARADRVRRSARGKRRRRAQRVVDALKKIKSGYRRTKSEISNNPSEAWARLIRLESLERDILPDGTRSYLIRELQVSLADAFANRGSSLFERGKYPEAFEQWNSGFKLDKTNPNVLGGLKRLSEKAERLAQEAELSSQRGDGLACDRWRRITRMTAAESEVHKKARAEAFRLCQ